MYLPKYLPNKERLRAQLIPTPADTSDAQSHLDQGRTGASGRHGTTLVLLALAAHCSRHAARGHVKQAYLPVLAALAAVHRPCQF